MKPGNLDLSYFGSVFFAAYGSTLELLEFPSTGLFKAACRSVLIKTELLCAVGCLDSGLL